MTLFIHRIAGISARQPAHDSSTRVQSAAGVRPPAAAEAARTAYAMIPENAIASIFPAWPLERGVFLGREGVTEKWGEGGGGGLEGSAGNLGRLWSRNMTMDGGFRSLLTRHSALRKSRSEDRNSVKEAPHGAPATSASGRLADGAITIPRIAATDAMPAEELDSPATRAATTSISGPAELGANESIRRSVCVARCNTRTPSAYLMSAYRRSRY